MKKPQCKDTCVKPVCQGFYRQYMLSKKPFSAKKCYKAENLIHCRQILLKLTLSRRNIREKDVLSTVYNRHYSPAGKHHSSAGLDSSLFRIVRHAEFARY